MSEGLKSFDDRKTTSSEVERRNFEDLIVLGNAVPDEISDNRKTVCTVAFSEEYGLIRIYPVPPNSPMKRWNVVSIPLERNPRDNRKESWKIQGSKDEWDTLSSKIIVKKRLSRKDWVALVERLKKDYSYGCVEELNEKQLSLGIIIPKIVDKTFEQRKDLDSSIQSTLVNDDLFMTIKNYKIRPKISYNCPNCQKKLHNQGVLEWGVYEYIRTDPITPEKVWDNLHIGELGYDQSFLVGNMNLYRNNFMIISVFRYKV
jgi:hypothetical protein